MPLQADTRIDVFESIFLVFLGLGTLVGVVVIAYTLYNAYKYRDNGDLKTDDSLPTLGELPTGGKGGKKLFLSFGISAIIVISLIIWTYGMLLYVEDPSDEFEEDPIEIDVLGNQFAWYFEYENGVESINTMTVPADHPVAIEVTGGDVWHSFGISDLRVKADAIPGEYDETWFMAEEAGEEHTIECFELCGDGHSAMDGTVQVMEQDEFDEWLDNQLALDIEIVTEDEESAADAVDELELVHVEDGTEYTFDADDFDEEGTLELNEELEQGGDFELTIAFDEEVTYEDEATDTIEDSFSVTSPSSESYTIEANGDETDDEDDNDEDDGGDDE